MRCEVAFYFLSQKEFKFVAIIESRINSESRAKGCCRVILTCRALVDNRDQHSKVPQTHMVGGVSLGEWVKKQRQATKNTRLSDGRRAKLEEVDFVCNMHSGI